MANIEKLLKSLEFLRISPGTTGNDDFPLKYVKLLYFFNSKG